jgi:hypothetical protein
MCFRGRESLGNVVVTGLVTQNVKQRNDSIEVPAQPDSPDIAVRKGQSPGNANW